MIRHILLSVICIACMYCSPKINAEDTALTSEIRSYKLENTDTLVDIGCGDAVHDKQIASYYPNLYFVLEDFPFDNKGHNIQKNLENRFKSIKHQYRFVAGREDTIPLASATYKRVICRRTIHEFTNRQKMASELVRILADGGILTVIEGIPEQPGFVDPYCNKPYLTKEEIINSFPSLTVLTDTVIVYPKWKLSMINFTKKKQIIN